MTLRGWIILVLGLICGCSSAEDPAQTGLVPSQQATSGAAAGAPNPPLSTALPQSPPVAMSPAQSSGMPPVTPSQPAPPPAQSGQGMPQPPASAPPVEAPPPRDPLPAPRISFLSFAVTDIEKSLAFYVGSLGMDELGRRDLGTGTAEVSVGFADAPAAAGLLLLSTPDRTSPLDRGNAYSRFGLTVSDINGLVMRLQSAGVPITTRPTRTASLGLTYAMITDPDGYTIEMIENDMPVSPDLPRIGFVSFNIADEAKTMDFYVDLLGMTRTGMYVIGNGTTEIFIGFADAPAETALVLLSTPSRSGAFMHGNAFNRFGMRVTDLDGLLMRASGKGVVIEQPATRDEAMRLRHAIVQDPDAFKLELQQYE